MNYGDLPTLERPAADLSLLSTEGPAARRRAVLSRRQAIGSVGVVGMIAFAGAKMLGPLGRARAGAGPITPGNSSCDVNSLSYWANGAAGPCTGSGYAVDDNCNGCNGAHRGTHYCRHRWHSGLGEYVVDFNARHVGCGETVPGVSGKQYKFRTNVCHSGSYDGWQWWSDVDCPTWCTGTRTPKFACNDGWVSMNNFETCYPSICMTRACVQQ